MPGPRGGQVGDAGPRDRMKQRLGAHEHGTETSSGGRPLDDVGRCHTKAAPDLAHVGNYLALGCKSIRRNSCAFAATTRVEALIRMAPTAGGSKTPTPARTPAASGTAIRL